MSIYNKKLSSTQNMQIKVTDSISQEKQTFYIPTITSFINLRMTTMILKIFSLMKNIYIFIIFHQNHWNRF